MPFNIQDFVSEINNKNGLMRPNKFSLTMAPPPCLASRSGLFRTMEFWCESTTLPGNMIATYDYKRYGYGPIEKRPQQSMFQPLQTIFNSDGKGEYIKFFNDWLQYIYPHNWYTSFNQPSPLNLSSMYEVNYKQDYTTDIYVNVYNPAGGDPTLQYVLKEAFPIQIMDTSLSWNSPENMTFQVNFEYFDWVEQKDVRLNYIGYANLGDIPPLNQWVDPVKTVQDLFKEAGVTPSDFSTSSGTSSAISKIAKVLADKGITNATSIATSIAGWFR